MRCHFDAPSMSLFQNRNTPLRFMNLNCFTFVESPPPVRSEIVTGVIGSLAVLPLRTALMLRLHYLRALTPPALQVTFVFCSKNL